MQIHLHFIAQFNNLTTWWKTTSVNLCENKSWHITSEWRWERDRPWSHCLASTTTCFVLQIMIEGVKAGPSEEGDLAFDDVLLLDAQCSQSVHCDFETNMCSWSNVGSDEDDWFRRRGNSRGPPGPSVDHTTLTPFGQLYLQSSLFQIADFPCRLCKSRLSLLKLSWKRIVSTSWCLTLFKRDKVQQPIRIDV